MGHYKMDKDWGRGWRMLWRPWCKGIIAYRCLQVFSFDNVWIQSLRGTMVCINSRAELFAIKLPLFQLRVPDKCVSMKENHISALPTSDLIMLTVSVYLKSNTLHLGGFEAVSCSQVILIISFTYYLSDRKCKWRHWAYGRCNGRTRENTQNVVISKKQRKEMVPYPGDWALSWKACFVNLKAIFPAGRAWVRSPGESTLISLSSPGISPVLFASSSPENAFINPQSQYRVLRKIKGINGLNWPNVLTKIKIKYKDLTRGRAETISFRRRSR